MATCSKSGPSPAVLRTTTNHLKDLSSSIHDMHGVLKIVKL